MHRRGASLARVIMPRYVQTNNQRKVQRAGKGSLKQRQIGKRCVVRYTAALGRFFFLIPYLFGAWASTWEDRDLQVGAYVELLWSEGEARSMAGDLLSALQWHYSVRKVLTGSWQKFKTWSRLEPCAQVLPLPISALFAIVGYAISIGDFEFAAGVYLAFHCMLRTAESKMTLSESGCKYWIRRRGCVSMSAKNGYGVRMPVSVRSGQGI